MHVIELKDGVWKYIHTDWNSPNKLAVYSKPEDMLNKPVVDSIYKPHWEKYLSIIKEINRTGVPSKISAYRMNSETPEWRECHLYKINDDKIMIKVRAISPPKK